MPLRDTEVSLIHDYLVHVRGGERVLLYLHQLFPRAPVYTIVARREALGAEFADMELHTSFLQHVPFSRSRFRAFLPLYPAAVRSFRFPGRRLVISSSSAAVKNIRVPEGAMHICYCHTPLRALWQDYDTTMTQELPVGIARQLATPLLWRIREWDRRGSANVHHFIANSALTARRIQQYYGRESTVINPPVDVGAFHVVEKVDDYFLIVSQLVPYKRVDLAVDAFNRLGLPLVVVGDGPQRAVLEAMARPNVRFRGRVGNVEMASLYARCRALIFPGVEDFGIVPLEAMASGRPVIAFRGGGVLETVVPGLTGLFFDEQSPDALCTAVRQVERHQFDPARIRAYAEQFDVPVFQDRIREFITRVMH